MSKKPQLKKRKAFMRDSDSESHHSEFQSQKPIKVKNNYCGEKNGRWDQDERNRYFLFVDAHKRILDSEKFRRSDKIYAAMAKFVETRSHKQCKSHHYKMIKKYGTFESILEALKQDRSTKISNNFNPRVQFSDLEDLLCQLSDEYELPKAPSPKNKDFYEHSPVVSNNKMQESIKFAEIQDFYVPILSYADVPVFNNQLQLSLKLSQHFNPTI